MVKLKYYFKKTILITISMIMVLAACGQKTQKNEPSQMSTEQQSEKVPEQLQAIESSIEKIINTLNGPSAMTKGSNKEDSADKDKNTQSSSPNKDKDSKDQGSSDSSSDSSSSKGEKQGSQQKQSQGQSKDQGDQKQSQEQTKGQAAKPANPWEKITPTINSLHYQWNSLMPLAAKQGANKQLIENFSNGLNSLTNSIISKNPTNTLMASSYLYAYVPDLYSLYRTKNSPEIKRIRHYARNAMLNAMTANWTQADVDMNNLKSHWSLYKNMVSKEQMDSASKLDFSLYELEKVIKEKSQTLTDIKGRITLSNIDTLEQSMEQGSKGQQKQS